MMTNAELENKVKQAFTTAAPNDFDAIQSDCLTKKGEMIIMTEKTTGTHKWLRRVAGMAAAFLLILGASLGFITYRTNYAVDATISLDVNPSIEIQVNQKERVLSVVPLNDDGKVVLGDMDLKGSNLEVAVNALIGSMLKNGYLSDMANSILVSVDNGNPAKGAELQQRLAAEINNLLQADTFSGAVLSQTIKEDSDIQKLAGQYGITLGKAQLIQQIVTQNPEHNFADLVSLSINELNLIAKSGKTPLNNVDSVGTASDKGYIGEASAKQAALRHAGVNEADIRNYECEMDYENGKMVYEVEFDSGEYEYEYDIDATTGDVIWSQKQIDDDRTPTTDNNSGSSQTGTGLIDPQAAKTIAYQHAGVSADSVTNVKCEQDWENGRAVYEIEFDCNSFEYDYCIDATTGEILKSQKEADDHRTTPTTGSASGSTAYIGQEAAKNAALSHAGATADSVRNLQCELEQEHGKMIYEVEFIYSGLEYTYEIDALSGTVLDYEIDR